MSKIYLYNIFAKVYIFLPLAVAVALIVIGIIIIACRVKLTQFLGLYVLIPAAASLLYNISYIGMRYFGDSEKYAKLITPSSAVSSIGTLAGTFFLCLFIHKKYGNKFIYIPLMLTPVIVTAATSITIGVLNRTLSQSITSGMRIIYWQSMSSVILSFVGGIVSTVFVVLAFYRNKDKETVIPKAWLVRLIVFICSAFYTFFQIFYYGVNIASGGAYEYDVHGGSAFFGDWYQISGKLSLFFGITNTLVALIFPVYVLIMVCKARRRPELE